MLAAMADTIDPVRSVLVLVDYQSKLLPAIHGGAGAIANAARLADAARLLGIRVVGTEENPAGLGPTCPGIRDRWGATQPIEKVRFSACVDNLTTELSRFDRPHVIITGVEAHVCVQQTVLDLLRRGYTPYVCRDAVSSRRRFDAQAALDRMRDAGAILTTVESVIFELVGQAGTPEFKRILQIVK